MVFTSSGRSIALRSIVAFTLLSAEPLLAQQVQSTQPEDDEPTSESDFSKGFFAEADVGIRYDSAVAINQLDVVTREDDRALRARLRVGYEADITDSTEATLSYGLTQTTYEDFSNFDLQQHTLAASASHDLGGARAGASYRYIHARLDGDGLLDIHRVAPYVSGFIAKGVYTRAELLYRDSNFLTDDARDNEGYGAGLDFYFFMDRNKRYIAVGYDYINVDALDDQFDFNGHAFQVRVSQKFPIGSDEGQFRAGWRYQLRDHTAITPQIGVEREDNRHRLLAEVEVPLNKWLGLAARYSYFDFASNLETVDYTQSLVDLTLVSRF